MRLLLLVVILVLIICHFTYSLNKEQKSSSSVQSTTVLILGGGLSGVSAANKLQSSGMTDFLLFEATGRLGGRMRNTNFYGYTIEEGANWIHGVNKNNNPVLTLAKACNLQYFNTTDTDTISARNSNGTDVTNAVSIARQRLTNATTLMNTAADQLDSVSSSTSLQAAMNAYGGWNASSPEEITAEYYKIDFLEAQSSNKVSFLANLINQNISYGNEEVLSVDPEGFAKIVRCLANQTFTTNDSRLHFNETVTEIHYALANETSLPTGIPNYGVYVKTASGNLYWAKYCIITFPNAVLLSGNINFVPNLPDWKVHALNVSGPVVYNKIFVKFADNISAFWDTTQWLFNVDSDPVIGGQINDTGRSTSPAVQIALQQGNNYTRGYYTVWLNLTIQGMLPGSNMLMVAVVDEMAKYVEQLSNSQLTGEITAVLRRMYGPQVPAPVGVYCTKWFNNSLTLGSFYSLRVGATSADFTNLPLPVNNLLYFAGDGTDPNNLGVLQGALLTGISQASAVVSAISSSTSSSTSMTSTSTSTVVIQRTSTKSSSVSRYAFTSSILGLFAIIECIAILYSYFY